MTYLTKIVYRFTKLAYCSGHKVTLTLDFQGHFFLRNGMSDWQETKVIWIEAMLDLLYDLDLWPAYDLDLGFSRSNFPIVVSGRGSLLGMKWKWCELIRCWTHYMTLTFDPTHDFDLVFLGLNFKIAVFQKYMGPALFGTFAQMYNKMNNSCKWQHGKEQMYGSGVSQTTV